MYSCGDCQCSVDYWAAVQFDSRWCLCLTEFCSHVLQTSISVLVVQHWALQQLFALCINSALMSYVYLQPKTLTEKAEIQKSIYFAFSVHLTFANNSQMAATVRTPLLRAGPAGNSCLFNCCPRHYLFIKMFLHTSVKFLTPENKLRRPAWCQLWLLYFWKIPDVSVCTPGNCWRWADSVWTHAPPHRSLYMHAVYFELGVLLIALIFDDTDKGPLLCLSK